MAVLFVEFAQTCAGTVIDVPPGGGAAQLTVKLKDPVFPPPSFTLIVFAPVVVTLIVNVCAPRSLGTYV